MENKKKANIFEICSWAKPTAEDHKAILLMVNRRRPYRPSDFKKQSFIPDLDEKTR